MSPFFTLRRGVAGTAGAALLGSLAVVIPTGAAQAAPTDPTAATRAATWMTSNLNAEGLLETSSEYAGTVYSGPSYGTSIDLALSLDQIGGHQAAETRITQGIAASVNAYTSYGDAIYAGSSAKALALATAQGRDATSFGGVDLQARVESTVSTAAPHVGRLQDQDPTPDEYWADYANTIGQAFAANALSDLGSAQAGPVTDYLLDQQCAAGFFRLTFSPATSPDQTCDGASPAEPAAQSPDTTALVITQLKPLAATNPEVKAAIDKAGGWLEGQQRADGSFADPQSGVNANSTGLAGQALGAAGRTASATRAAVWLRSLQVVGSCETRLAKETGAVAYNASGYSDGQKYGITDPLDRSQWIIADAQAIAALAWAPAAATGDKVGGPAFAKKGSKVSVTVKGLAAGERGCLGTVALRGTGKDLTARVSATSSAALTLHTAGGRVTARTQVLGKKKFAVKAPGKVTRGKKARITVKGLAAGEKVVVKLRGKKVAAGKASKKGVFTAKVLVKKKLRKGRTSVTVVGQYAHRTGKRNVVLR